MHTNSTIGARIRTARERAGQTQAELGKALRVTGQSVQAWETDKSMPRQSRFGALADALGVDAEWLLLGEDLDVTEYEDEDLGRISHAEGSFINLLRQLTLDEQLEARQKLEALLRDSRSRRKRRSGSPPPSSGTPGAQEAGEDDQS